MKDNNLKLSTGDHLIASIDRIDREGRNGWSIVWRSVGVLGGDWILRAERVQEIVEMKLEDESVETLYRTWDTFGGPGAYFLRWNGTGDDVAARFDDWANDLKAYVEGLERTRSLTGSQRSQGRVPVKESD